MIYTETLAEKLVVRGDHVVVFVLREVGVQSVARFG